MRLVIWTRDEDSGDLVPFEFGDVEEVEIDRVRDVRMVAKDQRIRIQETETSGQKTQTDGI